jgi:hypothetical protein
MSETGPKTVAGITTRGAKSWREALRWSAAKWRLLAKQRPAGHLLSKVTTSTCPLCIRHDKKDYGCPLRPHCESHRCVDEYFDARNTIHAFREAIWEGDIKEMERACRRWKYCAGKVADIIEGHC